MNQQATAAPSSTTWTRTLTDSVIVPAPPPRVFAWLDDPANTGMHMNRPSMAMFGGTLRVERLSATMTGVGTTYRSWGRVLGLSIDFTTTVTEWAPDRSKKWRTTGEPRLIVLGGFEMSFALTAVDSGTQLVLTISYDLAPGRVGRLGRLLGAPYARWCVRRIVRDAQTAFPSVS